MVMTIPNSLLYILRCSWISSNSISKRSKVFDKASTAKLHSAPIITNDTLRVNKSLLIGNKKYFSGLGGALWTVTDNLLDHDAYRLEYSDGHVDMISFDDILKLLSKSWSKPRDSSNEEALCMQGEPAFEEALFVHVEAVALIAYYNWSRSSQRYTIYYSQRLCSCYPRKEYDFLWVVCEVWVGLQKLITDLDRFYPYKEGA